jgi:hypothetical protein
VARPIPRDAPVTRAVLPWSVVIFYHPHVLRICSDPFINVTR